MTKRIVRREAQLSEQDWPSSIHPILRRVYATRGIQSECELSLDLNGLLPASGLKGMDAAIACLTAALQMQKHIVIVGDFDADGATSSALGVLALKQMGAKKVSYLVPNRFEFGYGLTPEIVDVAAASAPDLLITVDNGISSVEGVARAKELGLQVVVTDHHLAGSMLPAADAIVNPNQPGCAFASKSLAGVGVIFYVMTALRSHLRSINWFTLQGLSEPNMAVLLDLVALGTVADVVPLDRNNRILVHHGLRRIRAGVCRPGIKALIEVANRKLERVIAADLGFSVGPRLNAAGRLDDMSRGIECLMTDDEWLAKEYAFELDGLNQDRKLIEEGMKQDALLILKNITLDERELPYGISLYDDSWHQGVVGIVASRIKERFNRPVIAFATASDDGLELKGSARSVPGLNIRDAMDAVSKRNPHLIKKFGGHAMAAGLTLEKTHFEAFSRAFDDEVRRHLSNEDLAGEILSDGQLTESDYTLLFAQELREGGPWGQAFPEPLFDGTFKLLQQRIVGEKHLKLMLGMDNSELVIDAIAFNVDRAQWPSSAVWARVAFRLDVNEFRDRQSVQLMVEHLAPLESC